MARYNSSASNRDMLVRLEQAQVESEKRWQEFRQDSEQRRREFEQRWIEDRRLMLDTVREMKQDSHAREQRIEASFKVLESRVESLRWWVLGVGLTVIAAIAAIVIGG